MAQRPDTILHDMTSEGYGGSAYHNFNLSVDGGRVDAWIAPRRVRIVNALSFTTGGLSGSGAGLVSGHAALRRGGTSGHLLGTFTNTAGSVQEVTLVADTVIPHRVVVTLNNSAGTSPSGNMAVMAHYAFED